MEIVDIILYCVAMVWAIIALMIMWQHMWPTHHYACVMMFYCCCKNGTKEEDKRGSSELPLFPLNSRPPETETTQSQMNRVN